MSPRDIADLKRQRSAPAGPQVDIKVLRHHLSKLVALPNGQPKGLAHLSRTLSFLTVLTDASCSIVVNEWFFAENDKGYSERKSESGSTTAPGQPRQGVFTIGFHYALSWRTSHHKGNSGLCLKSRYCCSIP